MKIYYKISKFCSSWSNIGQFGPKKGQNWAKIAKTMSCWLEAIIRHFFNLVKGAEQKYFLKFPNFDLEGSQRVKLDPKKSQNWTKKGQNCVHGSRSQNKAPFSLCQGPWTQFFYEISKFCSSRSNIGQFGPKKYQNWAKMAKTMSYWLEAKIRHFFNLVKGTEQKYFLKFPNFDFEGS